MSRFVSRINQSFSQLLHATAQFAIAPPAWYFRYTFVVSLLIQLAFILVLHVFDDDAFLQTQPQTITIVVAVLFQLLQVGWVVLSSYRMVYFIIHDVVQPGVFVNMYLANVCMYSG
jgi:hypothetical protein